MLQYRVLQDCLEPTVLGSAESVPRRRLRLQVSATVGPESLQSSPGARKLEERAAAYNRLTCRHEGYERLQQACNDSAIKVLRTVHSRKGMLDSDHLKSGGSKTRKRLPSLQPPK